MIGIKKPARLKLSIVAIVRIELVGVAEDTRYVTPFLECRWHSSHGCN
ncbi:MAG: hypothetical protein JWM11_2363 [Planctomycetaceae bacterium]|nr:hypothetical protein [Planctomycetaceae bacterium]